jgi:hypothetical protein
MKVETNLKAGGFIQDAWNQTGRALGKAENFVQKANNQAARLPKCLTAHQNLPIALPIPIIGDKSS